MSPCKIVIVDCMACNFGKEFCRKHCSSERALSVAGRHLSLSRENQSMGFSTRSDTNRVVQPQKMARGLKLRIYLCSESKNSYLSLYFRKFKIRFSHDAAHLESPNDSLKLSRPYLKGLETPNTAASFLHAFL